MERISGRKAQTGDQKSWRMPKARLVESVPAEDVTPPRKPLPPGAICPAPLLLKRVGVGVLEHAAGRLDWVCEASKAASK